MKYVLIILYGTVTTYDFSSKDMCEQALAALKRVSSIVSGVCVPR